MKKKRTGKRWIKVLPVLLAVILCVGMVVSAMAAAGDRTLIHMDNSDGFVSSYITDALQTDKGLCFILNGSTTTAYVFPDLTGEAQVYTMDPEETTISLLVTKDDPLRQIQNLCWFSWKGEIYVLQTESLYDGESRKVEGGFVRKVVLEDGKMSFSESNVPTLDWTGMLEEDGDYQDSHWISKDFVSGDRLMCLTQNNYNGTGQMLMVFDLTSGEAEEIPLYDVNNIFPETENSVLMTRYDWSVNLGVQLLRFDLEAQSEETVSEMTDIHDEPGGFCWDEKSRNLYYVREGELMAAPDLRLEDAQAVNDCPITTSVDTILLEDGSVLLWGQNDVVIRNTDPSQRSSIQLVIQDSNYSQSLSNTLFDFSNARGDVSVVLRRDGNPNEVLQAMLNRDDQVDIYVLNYASSQFSALMNRGYLTDMSGTEAVAAAMNRCYPFLKKALIRDGKILAVPTEVYGNSMGIRTEAWEKAGGTKEELPKTWDAFFDWLESLPERLEGKSVNIVDPWQELTNIRSSLLNMILNQYQASINAEGRDYAFNTPLLRGVLERMDRVDFEKLGVRDNSNQEEEESMSIVYDEEYKPPIVETYASVLLTGWNDGIDPLAVSFEEGGDPILPVNLYVAFVNPYSKNQEAAMQFLAMSLDHLPVNYRYSAFEDETEPLRYPNYEESKKEMQQWLEQMKQALEQADDENREQIAESVKSLEEYLESIDETEWMVSPASIAAYQGRVQWVEALNYDLTSSLVGNDEGEGGYYDLSDNYSRGTLSAEELLSTIDKKVQMMRLEGD